MSLNSHPQNRPMSPNAILHVLTHPRSRSRIFSWNKKKFEHKNKHQRETH